MDTPPQTKVCCRCGLSQTLECFPSRVYPSGARVLRAHCRKCGVKATQASQAKRPLEERRDYQRRWCAANPEKRKAYAKTAYRASGGKDRSTRWREANREKCREASRQYRAKHPPTPAQRIRRSLENALRNGIYRRGKLKARATETLRGVVGCSSEELTAHLESLWQPGMSWENYGIYKVGGPMTWHVDHIVPCSSFDLTDPEQQRKCFHYTNLQPLWAVDNIRKSDGA